MTRLAVARSVVLDASALIAALSRESGESSVRAAGHAFVSAVNYAEVVAYFDLGGASVEEIIGMMTDVNADIVPFDADLAIAAGILRKVTMRAGLSLADRACLALARKLGVPAMTADRAWASVASAVGVEIVLIR